MNFSGGDALVFVFEMPELQDSFIPDGEKEIIKILNSSWGSVFQVNKFCKIGLGIHGIHDLERFQKALVILVHFHDGTAFYILTVVPFFLVVNIKIEKIGDILDISLQGTDGIAHDVRVLKLERVEKIVLNFRIGCRRTLQSLDDEGISGKVKIFFHLRLLYVF